MAHTNAHTLHHIVGFEGWLLNCYGSHVDGQPNVLGKNHAYLRTLDLIPYACCIGLCLKAMFSSVLCIEVVSGYLLRPPGKSWPMATTF